MPKMKTKRSAAKRFSRSGTGKLKRSHAFKRHILTKKTRKRKRQLGKTAVVDATNTRQVARMLPGT
jgi:large subunit ribosomal protein L35